MDQYIEQELKEVELLVLAFITPENMLRLKKLLPESLGGNSVDLYEQLQILKKIIIEELEIKLLAKQKTTAEHQEIDKNRTDLEAKTSLSLVLLAKIEKIIKRLEEIRALVMHEKEKKEFAIAEKSKTELQQKDAQSKKNIADTKQAQQQNAKKHDLNLKTKSKEQQKTASNNSNTSQTTTDKLNPPRTR